VTDLRIGAGTPPSDALKFAVIVTVLAAPATFGANFTLMAAVVAAVADPAQSTHVRQSTPSALMKCVTLKRKSILLATRPF
jgi:hypothetical protein